ncbi:mannose-6-phosphate isomerase, class I [Bacillus sp. ISL-40]|uniref:mannose-6-phosphate isomerase, class I n=1 Tax=unclassified Bacillus (in: firmicutes) TaxID=185979 RepID=UPI001BEB5346|nr:MULTISPECIES: mannose-6-phosphate isomerase, class I [unclassified Bacillus (in: firmicutes)]MBT2699432.1 mannose-6-phosphate isomerase, class I [Bacillus sp. ISL-40]MBT2719912.1 mannose-6-phosphate isomerase, class I [Bacillus sp. ISL-46]MBT2742733.1 mannose-6-phosphate isomerase, class I [Bacillus sp. ISL-77]
MLQPLFLKPVFKERIWGGTALQKEFGYSIPNDKTGECWAISAHPNGPSMIENGPFAGKTLDVLWKEQPELFGNPTEDVFPLLTKILDANMDLSVQVHPGDTYAKIHENGELGKTECWYIIDCKEDADMIFGHNAKTKEELIQQTKEGRWEDLLRRVKIKPGDFFYVPSGTIHALCEGTLVLETQQSSDTTYRVYDYDRRDAEGNLRDLHLEKAIDVTSVPHQGNVTVPKIEKKENATITSYVESDFFSVYKWDVNGKSTFDLQNHYVLLSVIKGEGTLVHQGEAYQLDKGTHLIIPVGFGEFEIAGDCQLIVSHT